MGIVGGGATGTLCAISLLKRQPSKLDIFIFEPAVQLGVGLAYKATSPEHLLNVPVDLMSADVQSPLDFMEWCHRNHPGIERSRHYPYVPRYLFGQYIDENLQATLGQKLGSTFTHVNERVTALSKLGDGWKISLPASSLPVDRLIIATGFSDHIRPPPELKHLENDPRLIQPYEMENRRRIGDREDVAILGAGLTAIDVYRDLRARGHLGRLYLISRRGLLPLERTSSAATPGPLQLEDLAGRAPLQIFQFIRRQNRLGYSYQTLADGIRKQAQRIWQTWTPENRSQFLRHIKPYWEIARHRAPESVLQDVKNEIAQSTIELLRGRILSVSASGAGSPLTIDLKIGESRRVLRAGKIFLATGFSGAKIPFAPALEEDQPRNLWILGPAGKTIYWEITAISEIRAQIDSLASQIAERV